MQCSIRKSIRKSIVDLYLDYTNNYLTVAAFALDNNLSIKRACQIIDIGRRLNEVAALPTLDKDARTKIAALEGAIKITESRRRQRGYLSQTEKIMILNFQDKIREIKQGK